MKKLRAGIRVKTSVLLATWLMLVLLPFFCFKLAITSFFANHFQQNLLRIQPVLYTEMQNFCGDLDEKTLLRNKLAEFDQENGFKTFDFSINPDAVRNFENQNAKSIFEKLENRLKTPVSCVFYYGNDTQKVDFYSGKRGGESIKPPPRIMMKRMFSILNNQQSCEKINPRRFKSAFPGSTDLDDAVNRHNYTSRFLQMTFKTIYPPKIKSRQLLETAAASGKTAGNMFFYFSPAHLIENSKIYNLGGYLVAIRLKDIKEETISKFAVKRSVFQHVKRRIGFQKTVLNKFDDFSDKNLSSFHLFKDRYSLITIIPQNAIVRRVQKGTFFPDSFEDFEQKTAAIETSIELKDLQHHYAGYFKEIDFFLKLLLLMGTAVFFRVWLYGLNFKASISAKIFIATALACLVPLLSLYALNIVYSSQEELAFRENLKKLLEAKHRYIQSIIDSGISRFRQNTASLGTIIEKKQNFDNDYLQSLFADWCLKNCAMGVIFQKLDQKKFDYVTDEARKDSEFMRLWELKKFFFSSLVEFLLQSPIITSNPEKFSTLLTEGTDNAESVHQILTMNGRLVSLSRIAQSTRLSGILIQDPENENQVPIAYLAIEYSLNKMFDQIFARSFGNFKFADELAEFKIDTAIAQSTDKGYQFAKGCISQNLNRQLALKQISDQSRIKKTIFRQSEQNGKIEYTMISFSPQLPYATYIKASKTSNRTDFFASIYFWAYPILILATALLLAGIFFVLPVTTLTRGLSEIAGGNLSFRLKIETDDEFTKLANEFNAMTKGLIEKEKLEQFVSPDVIEEINRSTEAEMTPGGEKIEASILFSTFAKKQSENTDPNEAVRQLDIFLGICNSICSQNHGVIDKIIGNTIMMVFRGQHTEKPHWLRACETATQIQAAMQPDQRNNSIKCASGISSGTVVSGKIGSKNGKLDFTVIGDTVNMAARLKSMAEKESESCIIVSDKVGNKIKEYWNLIELEPVAIKGKAGKFKTWRISEEI